ncbi:AraC family transcriptional regulator [Undibacterium arcticum]|uniref:AraC family transcriptional regulator n=1 Tax=Undibacterium arcticum TaxID=1762892 RepID=A0ABV7F865_9BURK
MPIEPITHTQPQPGMAPSAQRPVRLIARDLDTAELLAAHSHRWGQVTHASLGLIRVTVGNSSWIVPPLRAIWIPPNALHEIVVLEKANLRALYVDAELAPFQGTDCEVLNVSALLRELIAALAQADPDTPRETKLAALILDELAGAATLPIRVALPTDKRLKALCEMMIAAPGSRFGLDDFARHVGASGRTLARLFERDLGMSFSQWRQQMRLAHAAQLIARGMPMSQVAADLGYASQSAFSAMFKKTFGQSPSVFFDGKAQ